MLEFGVDGADLPLDPVDLVVQQRDDVAAPVAREHPPRIGLVDHGRHGVGPLRRTGERLQLAGKLLHAEEPAHVPEDLRLVGGEIRGQRALGGALPPLELARGAGSARTSVRHHESNGPVGLNQDFECLRGDG